MNQRQAVAYIGAYLWRRERFGMLFTFLFAVYLGAINSTAVDGILDGDKQMPTALHGFLDFLNLTMYPIFGLVMNKSSWGMWRDDYYSKRLAQWRTMPVPVSAIVWARMLQSGVMMPIVAGIYLLLQYAISPQLRGYATPVQWLENGLIWLAYATIIVVLLIGFELGFTGKQYFLMYLGIMALAGVIVTVLTWQGINIFKTVLDLTRNGYGWALLLTLSCVAVFAVGLGHRLTVDKIRARSLPL
ncbi:hypothetical protein [Cohnella hongkongensis]|uniref:ABC transporter permease n=1 Tax=Cohnella hongkongensis TaxID=178337 RepID=A0ABV9FKC7_9BACL